MAGAKCTRSMAKAIPDMAIGSKHTIGAVIISANTSTVATKARAITAGASSVPDTIPKITIAIGNEIIGAQVNAVDLQGVAGGIIRCKQCLGRKRRTRPGFDQILLIKEAAKDREVGSNTT